MSQRRENNVICLVHKLPYPPFLQDQKKLTEGVPRKRGVTKKNKEARLEGMALETCFQMSTIASTTTTNSRARFLHAHHPSHKEKHNFPANIGLKRAISALSSSSPPSTSIPSADNRRKRFICQAKHAVDEVLVVNDANWDSMVIGCGTPVLVEFWAPWCGPCRMIAPVIDELAKDYAGKITCCKVNTDECPNIASKYGIRSIPTVLLFKNGDKKESVIGAVPKSTLSGIVDKYLEM